LRERARYYDPKIGRFISEDPIGFAGGDVNFFAYVGDKPANQVDPAGLVAFVCAKRTAGAIVDVQVELPIEFWGLGAKPPVIARFKKTIETRWSGVFPFRKTGDVYILSTTVTGHATNRVYVQSLHHSERGMVDERPGCMDHNSRSRPPAGTH
jgi:uncharacterized protein RhaS with RHS repeats